MAGVIDEIIKTGKGELYIIMNGKLYLLTGVDIVEVKGD